jgi:hypothetical protein
MLSLVLGSELRNSLRHGLPLDKDDLQAYVLCLVVPDGNYVFSVGISSVSQGGKGSEF